MILGWIFTGIAVSFGSCAAILYHRDRHGGLPSIKLPSIRIPSVKMSSMKRQKTEDLPDTHTIGEYDAEWNEETLTSLRQGSDDDSMVLEGNIILPSRKEWSIGDDTVIFDHPSFLDQVRESVVTAEVEEFCVQMNEDTRAYLDTMALKFIAIQAEVGNTLMLESPDNVR